MTVHDLSREQLIELKCNYMTELVNEGTFAEVMGRDYDEPDWDDIANADAYVPDDVIFRDCEGIDFVPDDFFCSANLPDYDHEPAGWDLRHGEYEGDQEMLWN